MPSTTITDASNTSMYGTTTARPTNPEKNNSIQKLSTGSRINTASDDAAGLKISERLKSESDSQRVAAAGGSTQNNSASSHYSFSGQLPPNNNNNNSNSSAPPLSPDSDSYAREQSAYASGGVSNTAGAPSGPNREQALERYQATESSNSSESSLRTIRG